MLLSVSPFPSPGIRSRNQETEMLRWVSGYSVNAKGADNRNRPYTVNSYHRSATLWTVSNIFEPYNLLKIGFWYLSLCESKWKLRKFEWFAHSYSASPGRAHVLLWASEPTLLLTTLFPRGRVLPTTAGFAEGSFGYQPEEFRISPIGIYFSLLIKVLWSNCRKRCNCHLYRDILAVPLVTIGQGTFALVSTTAPQ